MPEAPVVLYERRGPVAYVTMNRPRCRNAQNRAMTCALDDAFYRAADDPEVKVAVLAGAGQHFSAGHDIGTPERDAHLPFERRAGLWWDPSGRAGAESRFARESDPGVEYFAHPWAMPPRIAKEFLYTGDRTPARRAYELGVANRVVGRAELADETGRPALRTAEIPGFGLALPKRAVNRAEDLQGLHTGMDSAFGLHHLAHAHNAEKAADSLGGMNTAAMKEANT
ncbi:enoyl-CoA hydratase-related protein [Streptomyces sp. MB09-01]|uniref:enoyl-CoA hydratase-related protein n=1 Tax=Streptomyces sp. MB09-01 TaxID=3028666 RepID=UPI0029B85E30|nr:enoyl-CoA hydratase-related protein [Streptomyces sp. MB09-01]MDX3535252.1 enoyl-CoA hydratase-related protein [Streptomyces sp. MB09-01]